MKRIGLKLFMSLALLAMVTGAMADTVRRWDFTNWSEETKTNLLAVIAENKEWSDIEKAGVDAPTDISKENCFWQVGSGDATKGLTLTANGTVIKETEGLLFTHTTARIMAIAVNYPTTSLGTYHGASYLWLGGKDQNNFVIPNVKPGATIKMGVESHKPSDSRGVKLYLDWGNTGVELKGLNGETVEYPKTYTEQTWQVPASFFGTCDVTVYNNSGCHLYFIEVTEPETAASAATEASVVWAFNNTETYADYTATPDDMFSLANVDLGVLTVNGTGTGQAGADVTFLKLNSTSAATDVCKWQVKPAAGLTFTPTKISMYIQRFGTNVQNGVTVSASLADGTSVKLGNYTAPRSGKTQDTDDYGKNANFTNKVEITLTASQQLKLATTDLLTLSATIGVASGKQGGFSDVQIHGILTGEKVELPKYTLIAATNIDGAGVVTVAPSLNEYEEGSEVKLTAVENFGYDFVNWTNAAGIEVSAKADFTYTIDADETLTANFKAVETYELAMALEGGANDYMVSYSPAPTIVDGKQMYEAGTAVKVTAASNGILTFQQWADGATNNTFTVTMDADKAYTATYRAANYIVGWDFYKAGKQDRPADFASTSANESAAFCLVNENGETAGWLDKSTEAAKGYETFEGAAVNWKDLGKYWYQFQIDATGFSNIRVDAEMMFNYNAYTTILVQYSVDGTAWKDAGKLNMSKAKTEYPISVGLGEDANNAATLYVRFYPDKTAGTAGTESTSDGTTITNVFVYSDEQLVVTDGADFAPKFDSYTSATYTRKFNTAYNYGTICLPFAPDAETCAKYTFYALDSYGANALVFTEVDAPAANTAYLYCAADKQATTHTFTGGKTTVSNEMAEPVGDYRFIGVLAQKVFTLAETDGTFYVYKPTEENGYKDVFGKAVGTTMTVKPYRAYIHAAAAAQSLASMRIVVRGAGDNGDGTTGIEEVITPDQIEGAAPAIYNLMGQPVAQPVKGQIYIVNGKKVVY